MTLKIGVTTTSCGLSGKATKFLIASKATRTMSRNRKTKKKAMQAHRRQIIKVVHLLKILLTLQSAKQGTKLWLLFSRSSMIQL